MASSPRCGLLTARTLHARSTLKAEVCCVPKFLQEHSNTTTKAAPFHPKDLPPRAACPQCLREKDDDTPRELYPIHGLSDGQYDPKIPEQWLSCPAVDLNSSLPGMEALRVRHSHDCLLSIRSTDKSSSFNTWLCAITPAKSGSIGRTRKRSEQIVKPCIPKNASNAVSYKRRFQHLQTGSERWRNRRRSCRNGRSGNQ